MLYRRLPGSSRSIAYVPEGPVIDWSDPDLARWLEPLCAHLRARKAIAAKIGPPVAAHLWGAGTLRDAVAGTATRRVRDLTPDLSTALGHSVERQLTALGWRRDGLPITGRGEVQPSLVFEVALAGLTTDELWAGLSQQWRRNIRKAERSGVQVSLGGYDGLAVFHRLLGPRTTVIRHVLDHAEHVLRPSVITVASPRHVTLTGAPGNGKTTIAKFLVQVRAAMLNGGADMSADQKQCVGGPTRL